MNVSRRWLEAFLSRDLDPTDVADRLAMLGAPVDAIEPLHADLDGIVVALVEAVVAHPNADRLRVCTVNDGSPERRNVVCGASNVAAGHRYPFAPVGATLPGGLRIEKRKLRGEVSEGMLCSGRELGLSEDHEGLLELEGNSAPGTPLLEALPVRDDRLVVDVTPNRADLLGHKGIARELAASYGTPFRLPVIPGSRAGDLTPPVRAGAEGTTAGIRVAIADREGCARFLGGVIRGVRVGPSPAWLRARLGAVGLRSINNVVDATNYVLYELNQPLHAYDLATLRGGLITARSARGEETLRTLDDQERRVSPGMTVIADAERVIGVAGVMGGAETEVTQHTTDVFLECAWFRPAAVRATRKALGLSTDASQRFERGTDLWGAADAFRRGMDLILSVAGGEPDGPGVDVWPAPTYPSRVFLRLARVTQVLGVDLPLRTVEDALVGIGATVVAKPADGRLAVDVPGWRPDLTSEIDLVEEIARLVGYDRIPSDLGPFRPGRQGESLEWGMASRMREGLVALGLFETLTLPVGPDAGGVALANPLSSEHGYMRSALLPGLVRQVEGNWAGHTRDVRLFEIGTVFQAPENPEGRPVEAQHTAVVFTGSREPRHWTDAGRTPDLDRWDLKGMFESVAQLANPGATVQVEGDNWVARLPDGTVVGSAARLAADAPPWAAPLFGFEIEIAPTTRASRPFCPWPSMPAADRDLALVVPQGVPAADVIRVIQIAAGALLETVDPIDEYRGAGLGEGERSVAFRLRFRAADRTLRDAEVDAAVNQVCRELEGTLGVTLRTA